jgi:hypothetical protein
MCVSCGCGRPNDQHGDSRHITMQQIEEAAKAISKSPQEVANNIQQAITPAK